MTLSETLIKGSSLKRVVSWNWFILKGLERWDVYSAFTVTLCWMKTGRGQVVTGNQPVIADNHKHTVHRSSRSCTEALMIRFGNHKHTSSPNMKIIQDNLVPPPSCCIIHNSRRSIRVWSAGVYLYLFPPTTQTWLFPTVSWFTLAATEILRVGVSGYSAASTGIQTEQYTWKVAEFEGVLGTLPSRFRKHYSKLVGCCDGVRQRAEQQVSLRY